MEYFINKSNKTAFHYNSYCTNYNNNYLNDKGYIPKVGDYAIVSNTGASTSDFCGRNRNNLLNGTSSIDCHAHIGIVQSVDTKNKKIYLLEGNTNEENYDNHSHVDIIEYNVSTKTSEFKGATRNICKIVGFGSWY